MSVATITINEWEILLTTSLLIAEGEEAKILITPEDPLIIRVKFKSTEPKEGENQKATASILSDGGNDGLLLLSNWKSSLGAAITTPMEIAEDDKGYVIAIICSAKRMGNCHEIFLQFMRKMKS